MRTRILAPLVIAALPALIAIGVFWRTLDNGFIWDDPIVIKRQLIAFQSLRDIFLPPTDIPEFSPHYYRPLVILSYKVDQFLWGTNARGFHLSVVLIHALCSALVGLLGLALLRSAGGPPAGAAALAAGILFAVHPIHTESVCWMAGRGDPLAAAFVLAALLAYRQARRRPHLLWVSALLFLLGCLAKEVAVSLLVLLPAMDRIIPEERAESASPPTRQQQRAGQHNVGATENTSAGGSGKKPRPLLGRYLPFVVAALIYAVMRHAALRGSGGGAPSLRAAGRPFGDPIAALGFYAKQLLLPLNQNAFVTEISVGLWTLIAGGAMVVLAGAAAWRLLRGSGRVGSFLTFGFLATLAPSLTIAVFQISENPVAERYLYLPSAMACLLAGAGLARVSTVKSGVWSGATLRRAGAVVVLAVAAFFAWRTTERNRVWTDDFLFWSDVVAKSPSYGLPHLNLGNAYRQRRDTQRAADEYQAALRLPYTAKGQALAHNNLATIYIERHEYTKAEKQLREALRLRPHLPLAYYNLASLYGRRFEATRARDPRAAVEFLRRSRAAVERALAMNPRYVNALSHLMRVAFVQGDYGAAERAARALLELEPRGSGAASARDILRRLKQAAP